ncbi:hypothetical protein [Anaeromyxobacter diazotrophicus]|uniref:Uncharacterized protein n=1 Tax=Anaeromyxobacter diazotrophicus TaxID=2590199 RepID=A0A7I9VM28_9BACT|nr:hypothetical protein [Anaeromyxobacter diazotrophicus]GEJ57463.1 hypothetical protein AMYX_22040 [Anaeromyxobacter diazotrophicus]
MKPLRVILPVVLVGVVVLLVLSRLSRGAEADALRVEREALRREAVERGAVARGLSGPAGVEEAQAVVRWWLDAVAALRNRHPGAAAAEAPAPSKARQPEKASAEAAYRAYAAERLDALRAGYAPLLSAADQGLRLDVLAIGPGEHPDTHERALRLDFALWGAPRRLERDAQGARAAVRVVVPVAFRQLAFRFLDAAGKTYGEMTGSGEPYLVMKDPERLSPELPPGVVLGTWWVEPFPREAARVELAVGVQVQGLTSAALTPAFRWEVPVREDWKLRPGETFRAETREVAPEAAPAR